MQFSQSYIRLLHVVEIRRWCIYCADCCVSVSCQIIIPDYWSSSSSRFERQTWDCGDWSLGMPIQEVDLRYLRAHVSRRCCCSWMVAVCYVVSRVSVQTVSPNMWRIRIGVYERYPFWEGWEGSRVCDFVIVASRAVRTYAEDCDRKDEDAHGRRRTRTQLYGRLSCQTLVWLPRGWRSCTQTNPHPQNFLWPKCK